MAERARQLTPLELEIMQVLWADGPATVAEVQPKLKGDLAYTTVQTMLNVLLKKKKVKREAEGRAYRYKAVVSRERATGSAVEDMVQRIFGGSAEALVLSLVESRKISASELERVAKRIADAERTGSES